MNHQSIFSYQI